MLRRSLIYFSKHSLLRARGNRGDYVACCTSCAAYDILIHFLVNIEDSNTHCFVQEELELIVIVEVSLICLYTLITTHMRMRDIKHKHTEPFGGIDLILFRDLCQASRCLNFNERITYLLHTFETTDSASTSEG